MKKKMMLGDKLIILNSIIMAVSLITFIVLYIGYNESSELASISKNCFYGSGLITFILSIIKGV